MALHGWSSEDSHISMWIKSKWEREWDALSGKRKRLCLANKQVSQGILALAELKGV